MSATFRIVRLALLAAAVMVGTFSTAHADNCEESLKTRYRCTGTYSGGGSSDFCIRTETGTPGDGLFNIVEEETLLYYCTCEAKGRAPKVEFSASSKDFFCGGYETPLVGKASGSRITGQGYHTPSFTRSSFTCQAVETCP
jgi:hypothetical protein